MTTSYKFHFLIVMILLTIQFFSLDIYGHFHLKHIINKNAAPNPDGDLLYRKGEYVPLAVEEAPPAYELVLVKQRGTLLEEIYYTKKGASKVVHYWDGKWKSTRDDSFGDLLIFAFFPFCGVIASFAAMAHKMSRTGVIYKWQLMRLPYDRFEIICYSYGFSFILSTIVFGSLGKAPG
jgi:hypothetical protein